MRPNFLGKHGWEVLLLPPACEFPWFFVKDFQWLNAPKKDGQHLSPVMFPKHLSAMVSLCGRTKKSTLPFGEPRFGTAQTRRPKNTSFCSPPDQTGAPVPPQSAQKKERETACRAMAGRNEVTSPEPPAIAIASALALVVTWCKTIGGCR